MWTSNVVPAEIVRRPPAEGLRIFWLNHLLWCWEQLYHFRPTFSEIQQELTDFQTSPQQSMPQISSQQDSFNQRDVGQELFLTKAIWTMNVQQFKSTIQKMRIQTKSIYMKRSNKIMMANPSYIWKFLYGNVANIANFKA